MEYIQGRRFDHKNELFTRLETYKTLFYSTVTLELTDMP